MRPDDGTGAPGNGTVPGWSGTPAIRADGGGPSWTLLLETGDPYLDRYTLPMRTSMPADEVADWRERVRTAWPNATGPARPCGWIPPSPQRSPVASASTPGHTIWGYRDDTAPRP